MGSGSGLTSVRVRVMVRVRRRLRISVRVRVLFGVWAKVLQDRLSLSGLGMRIDSHQVKHKTKHRFARSDFEKGRDKGSKTKEDNTRTRQG